MMHPPYDRPGSCLEFFLKIQHAQGQKMIDPHPPGMTDQDLSYSFFLKIQHMHGQKMIDPLPDDRPVSPTFF